MCPRAASSRRLCRASLAAGSGPLAGLPLFSTRGLELEWISQNGVGAEPFANHEIEFATVQIDRRDLDPQQIAQAIRMVLAMPDQSMRLRIVVIVVVIQIANVNQPFGRQLNALCKQPEFLHSRDDDIQRFANLVLEKMQAASA